MHEEDTKISAPRIFSSKDTVYKIARESGIEGRTIREDEDSLVYNIQLPDIITDLLNKTDLTRKTIIDILINSKRLDDFKRNPQKYIRSNKNNKNKYETYGSRRNKIPQI